MPEQLDRPVVFNLLGAAGDLSRKMVLPAWFDLHRRGLLPEQWRLVGSGSQQRSDENFRDVVAASLHDHTEGPPPDWSTISQRLRFVGGGFSVEHHAPLAQAVAAAKDELGGEVLVVHYLAIPPSAFSDVTEGIAAAELAEESRVVYEKPYGTSLASFDELDALVKTTFREEQVFRIDHFLGKEAVQNLYVMRFANELFGGVWDREHVKQVQIDVPETLDIAQRATFYDATGAALDMLVTHLFQVAAQVTMEPPSDLRDPQSVLAAREDALASFRALDPEEVVLGQFDGYRDIDGVAPDSMQDTFVAARLWVDSKRWRGVPFLLRSGKRMAASAQQVALVLRSPRGPLADEADPPNALVFSMTEGGRLSIRTTIKTPGEEAELSQAETQLDLGGTGNGSWLPPYDSLLRDVLLGDRTLFTSATGLRHAFSAFAPLQDERRPAPLPYTPGSWGPKEAARLARTDGRGGWLLGE